MVSAYQSIGNEILLQAFIRKDDLMNTILKQYEDKINGTFSFFDRMIIKGHIFQLFSLFGRMLFLSPLDILLKGFFSCAAQVTSLIVSHVEGMTASRKRPLVYLTSYSMCNLIPSGSIEKEINGICGKKVSRNRVYNSPFLPHGILIRFPTPIPN